jgi:hypothetical protein
MTRGIYRYVLGVLGVLEVLEVLALSTDRPVGS